MEGSSSKILDVWVKQESLWEDIGGEGDIQFNYDSCEVKQEVLLVISPEKVMPVMNEKSKDNSTYLKEPQLNCTMNPSSVSEVSQSNLIREVKKEPDLDNIPNNEASSYSGQEIKKETECIMNLNKSTGFYIDREIKKEPECIGISNESVDLSNGYIVKSGWKNEPDTASKNDQKLEVDRPRSLQPKAAFALHGFPEQALERERADSDNRANKSTRRSDVPVTPTTDTASAQQDSLLIEHKPRRDTHACDVCGKEFKKMGKLTRHKKTHGEKPYACRKCHKKFTRPHHLREHDRSHTGDKPYSCDLCGKKFTLVRQLKTHKITHSNVKPFTCDVCQKEFTQFGHLMTHKRLHTGEKPYTCEICKRVFAQLVYLKEHVRIHSGVKEYCCGVCKKEFTRMGELRRHRLIHTKDKPYECETCKKAFKQSSHLKRHQLVHTKVKQFCCDICLKCFTQKSTLGKHKLLHCRKDSNLSDSDKKISDDKNDVWLNNYRPARKSWY